MAWKEGKLTGLDVSVDGTNFVSGELKIYVDTDSAGNVQMGPSGGPTMSAVPLDMDLNKPGLMKEFAALLADKTKDLNQENEELRAQLEAKDKEVEELRQKKDDLQAVVTDSFKVLVDKVAKKEP